MKKSMILLLLLRSFSFVYGQILENYTLNLNVVYLEDKRLPTISSRDIYSILHQAEEELKIRFNAGYIKFTYLGKKSLKSFFAKYLKTGSSFHKKLKPYKYRLFSKKIRYKPYKEEIKKFLKQWRLWDLKDFFSNEEQAKIRNYDDVIELLFKNYLKKLNILEKMRLRNGKFLIDRKNHKFNSYINWLTAMHFQDRYDIIITNTIIVYDDISKPYPHAVLRYAKVGGSSFESPKRHRLDGNASMVNLFEMLTDIKYFKKPARTRKISRSMWNKIIGRFILAHELGHMIYLIPDVYNHPRGCLMDSSFETMDYYEGYKILEKYREPCPRCVPYVTAREYHLLADQLMRNKNYTEAIRNYRIAIKMTPRKLDVNYNSYISLIYYKIAKAYLKLGDKDNAKFYIRESLEQNPDNKRAKRLYNRLNRK